MRKDEAFAVGIVGTPLLMGWLGATFGSKGILVGGICGTIISYFAYENSF